MPKTINYTIKFFRGNLHKQIKYKTSHSSLFWQFGKIEDISNRQINVGGQNWINYRNFKEIEFINP